MVCASGLAGGAPVGGALAEDGVFDGGLADAAGFTGAAVNEELLFEVAGLAVGVEEVAEGGAALFDGVGEDLFDGGCEFGGAGFGEAFGGGARADAGAEEGFGGVDVADTDDDFGVHDDDLDGGAAGLAGGVEAGCGEVV